MQATVREKTEVAEGTLLVTFDLLGREVSFEPGQYFWVTLPEPAYEDERGARRHFTVVTSPDEHGVLGFCTRLRESAFKRSVAELPVGAEVDVEEPKGSFALPDDPDRPLVFVAGGIGITPFRSMLRFLDAREPAPPVTLVYANRDRRSTAFLDELRDLERRGDWFRLVLLLTDDPEWEGDTRRPSADVIADHVGDLGGYTFLVAGPPGMSEAVADDLRAAGVEEEHVRAEKFSGY